MIGFNQGVLRDTGAIRYISVSADIYLSVLRDQEITKPESGPENEGSVVRERRVLGPVVVKNLQKVAGQNHEPSVRESGNIRAI